MQLVGQQSENRQVRYQFRAGYGGYPRLVPSYQGQAAKLGLGIRRTLRHVMLYLALSHFISVRIM